MKNALDLPSTPVGQLKSPEKRFLFTIKSTCSALTPSKTKGFNMLSLIDIRTLTDATLTASRKGRVDAGTSVFTHGTKKKATLQLISTGDIITIYRHNNTHGRNGRSQQIDPFYDLYYGRNGMDDRNKWIQSNRSILTNGSNLYYNRRSNVSD